MDITVKIEAPALVDAINALAVAVAGNIELLLEGPSARAAAPASASAEPKPVETKPAETSTAQTDSTATYTLEQVRAKLADLSRAGKQAEAKKLLENLGVKKLTDLPPEKYPEIMKAAEGI